MIVDKQNDAEDVLGLGYIYSEQNLGALSVHKLTTRQEFELAPGDCAIADVCSMVKDRMDPSKHPEVFKLDQERWKVSEAIRPFLNAARRKSEALKLEPTELSRKPEEIWTSFRTLEDKIWELFLTEESPDDVTVKRLCEEARVVLHQWHEISASYVKGALTPSEKEWAIFFEKADREKRGEGNTLFAKAIRFKRERMADVSTQLIIKYDVLSDPVVVALYVEARKAINMFCWSSDDQEAYDSMVAVFEKLPAEIKRAIEKKQSTT